MRVSSVGATTDRGERQEYLDELGFERGYPSIRISNIQSRTFNAVVLMILTRTDAVQCKTFVAASESHAFAN